jgi:hypothetical protein
MPNFPDALILRRATFELIAVLDKLGRLLRSTLSLLQMKRNISSVCCEMRPVCCSSIRANVTRLIGDCEAIMACKLGLPNADEEGMEVAAAGGGGCLRNALFLTPKGGVT